MPLPPDSNESRKPIALVHMRQDVGIAGSCPNVVTHMATISALISALISDSISIHFLWLSVNLIIKVRLVIADETCSVSRARSLHEVHKVKSSGDIRPSVRLSRLVS